MLSDAVQNMTRLGQQAPQLKLRNNSYGAVSRIGYDGNFARAVTQPSKASLVDLAYEIW